MQHADSDVGVGRRDSGLNLDPKTQTHIRVRSFVDVHVGFRVRIPYSCFVTEALVALNESSFFQHVVRERES